MITDIGEYIVSAYLMGTKHEQKLTRIYDEEFEKWYFSVVDIIQVLIQQLDYQAVRNYWKVLKNRLKKEGSETVTKYDGVVKSPIYCVAAHFEILDILYV